MSVTLNRVLAGVALTLSIIGLATSSMMLLGVAVMLLAFSVIL